MIIGEIAIAMKLIEVCKNMLYIVECVGPLRVTSHLRHLPRTQVGVDFLGELRALGAEILNLVADIQVIVAAH